jgi:hypothetical protein
MAMLMDGPPSSIEDLSGRDSDLLNVALSEGMDLTAKLQLAARDVEMTVESMLLLAQPSIGGRLQRCPTLRHIAVTPQLKLWHSYAALRLIYQDLYFSRLNDRYQAKAKIYGAEEARMLDELRATGLGVVFDPLPQALAPNIGAAQTGDAGGIIYVAVAFVNPRGEEGAMSAPVEADIADGTAAAITMSALADNAVGWNLYAGMSPDSLTKQNPQTLDPTASVTLAAGGVSSGPKSGNGQNANLLLPIPRRILRG